MNATMRPRLADERGMAMMMALGFMLTAGVLVATALAYATSLQPQARHGQDRVEALSAAQAGIDHYLGHLNKDRNYFATADCANPAMQGPNKDPALLGAPCGWTASTPYGWAKVQPGDPDSADFHYDINSAQMDQFTIWVSSTGRSGAITSTLQAKVSIAGSQRYLYVTDFEDADPENPVVYPSGASHDDCGKSGTTKAKYWWSPTPNERFKSGSPDCVEIQFISADTLDGPVHFNDTPLINGNATFKQGYTTYATGCPKTATTSASAAKAAGCYRGSGSPSLSAKGARWGNVNLLPDTTGDMVNKPGCQYTGDTRIRFNSNGTMDVWNTMSAGKTLGSVGNPAVVASAPNCGNATNFRPASGQKYPAAKQTVPVPDGLVIYVRNSPTSATCTPGQIVNGTTSGSATKDVIPSRSSILSGEVGDIGFLMPTYRKARGSSAWPTSPSLVTSSHSRKFDCGLGNVYVEGNVKGRVTIAAENNVVVTGDLTIANTPAGASPGNDPSDIVGLVAQNAVVVYHPVGVTSWDVTKSGGGTFDCGNSPEDVPTGGKNGSTCTYSAPTKPYQSGDLTNLDYLSPPQLGPDSDRHRWIYASIQTLAHSFWVESYDAGAPPGDLSVRGSIAQRWRGIVGTGSISTGYIKDYSYDKRLQTNSPPYFPPWANGDWAAETTGELPTPTGLR
ncbi:MAG: pilus assembly PilX N-terminal domain-containing protein [Candidatus Nanopelagicales bacterium]